MSSNKMHKATQVPIEKMSFYKSLERIQRNTGLKTEELLLNQVGFRAQPTHCICGHEWNIFDLVNDSIDKSSHDWSFFKTHLSGEIGGFFHRQFDMTCPNCSLISKNVDLLYAYMASHAKGWY